MPASPDQVRVLEEVQNRIDEIPYSDLQGRVEGPDDWIDTPAPGHSWVCRDYAIAKGRELQISGFHPEMLSIVTCWTEPVLTPSPSESPGASRLYHAVLAVSFQDEIWILDSRAGSIYRAEQPQVEPFPYLWDKQQIPGSVDARDASGGLI